MRRTMIWLAVQALIAALAACGGGGDQQGSTDNLPASPLIARHP